MGWTAGYKIIISIQKSKSMQIICEVYWKGFFDEKIEKINFIAVFCDGSTDSAAIKKECI